MHKYHIERLESDTWELETVATEEKQVFDLLKDVINHLKKDEGKFSVLDMNAEGIAYFEFSKIEHVTSFMGVNDDYMEEHYLGIKRKYDEYEDECYTCRGGGCIHCEPHRFI